VFHYWALQGGEKTDETSERWIKRKQNKSTLQIDETGVK